MRFDVFSARFEEIEKDQKKLALAASDEDLSWLDFSNRVTAFSEMVRDLGVPSGHPVIIYGHKEALFVIAMAALMSRDVFYIPVDTIIPVDRLKRIKEISGAEVIVNCTGKDINVSFPVEITATDRFRVLSIPDYNIISNEGDPIRYTIFTSGSTGEPKGVQISRSALFDFATWMKDDFGFSGDDVFVNQAPFSFDLSVFEVTCFLHLGATLVLNTNEHCKVPDLFLQRQSSYLGTVLVSTPSFVYLYLRESGFIAPKLPNLKTFLFCGEILPNKTAARLFEKFPVSRVLNTYGPTEATVATTLLEITKDICNTYPTLPVGFSKPRSGLRIANESGNEDEPGEIIIYGDNVSLGYMNNPLLNDEKFFQVNGKRAYRTGDVGYIREGMLFFNGRNDEQVKLHGFRIELDEINHHLRTLTFVDDAVTVPMKKDDEVRRLISFVILKQQTSLPGDPVQEIYSELNKSVPSYMLPSEIVFVDQFPYNANHKIDRSVLIEQYRNNQVY
jgi:D-alanine--poly(phosphoribitol) ligase subunit 1